MVRIRRKRMVQMKKNEKNLRKYLFQESLQDRSIGLIMLFSGPNKTSVQEKIGLHEAVSKKY